MNAAQPIPTFEEVMADFRAGVARSWLDAHPEVLAGAQIAPEAVAS